PFVLRRRPALRDPDDERILEVAVQCRAMIVTHNERDFVGAERFGISVRSPAEFLKILREGQWASVFACPRNCMTRPLRSRRRNRFRWMRSSHPPSPNNWLRGNG